MSTAIQAAAGEMAVAQLSPAEERELARQYTAEAFAVLPADFNDIKALASIYIDSGYFGNIKNAAQAIVKILAGRELGLSPLASMRGIFMFDGNIGFYAQTMSMLLKKHGYKTKVIEATAERCEIEFYFFDEPCGPPIVWDMKMAKTAGLDQKDNWRNYPEDMLYGRCMSRGCRRYAPEIFNGSACTPDEMDEMRSGTFLERRGSDEQMAAATEEKTAALRERMRHARPVAVATRQETPGAEAAATPTDTAPEEETAQEPKRGRGRPRKQDAEPEPEPAAPEASENNEEPPFEPEPDPEPEQSQQNAVDADTEKGIWPSERQVSEMALSLFGALQRKHGAPQPVPTFANIQKVFEAADYIPPKAETDGTCQMFQSYWKIEYQRATKPSALPNAKTLFGK